MRGREEVEVPGCGDEVRWGLEGPRGARDEGKLVSRMAMAMAESMS